jgi:hypothetical protein
VDAAASGTFRRCWEGQTATVERELRGVPGGRSGTAQRAVQRRVVYAADPTLGRPERAFELADRSRLLLLHGLGNPPARARRAVEILDDMVASAETMRFEDDQHLARELYKRMRVIELLHLSQPEGLHGFGYPFRAPAFAYGPRVNYAARDYWRPAPPAPWGYNRRPMAEARQFPTPSARAAHFHDQDSTGPYSFQLTTAGRANPYEALLRLFDPQPPHRRTLIHCDYLISVIQFRAFAESIGTAEFNRRVAAGVIPMVLWAHGFSDISHLPGRTSGTEPRREATSLQEAHPSSEADLVIGDHVQFWNHPAYDLLIGDDGSVWRMENAILVGRRGGQDEFEGHGSGRLTAAGMKQRLAAAFNAEVDRVLALVARLRSLRIGSAAHTAHLAQLRSHHIDRNRSGQFVITGGNFGLQLATPLAHITANQIPGLRWPPSWYTSWPGEMNLVYRPIESAGPRR